MANDPSQTPPVKPDAPKPTLRVQVKKPAFGDVKKKFGSFRPKSPKYRWWLLFGGFALIGIAVSTFSGSSGPKPVQAQKKAHFISLTPGGGGEKTWQAQAQGQVTEMKHQMTALQQQIQQLKQGMQAQTAALQSATQAIQSAKLSTPSQGSTSAQPESTNDSALPLPPPPPVPTTPTLPTAGSGYTPPSGKILEYSPAETAESKVVATTSYQKNKYAGFLPAGSFMSVALLNGVDAGTSTETQSNPQPVLMRVQANAVLPGAASYQLKSCFVLGSAYGSLSSQRVYVRSAMLSCVDQENHLVLNQKIQGYVVDSDGVLGLRGKVINRQGALLAKALLAGFASGLGQALSQASSTSTSMSALGAVQTVSGGQMLHQAGYDGAGNAATLLAQFYLKQAQAIFPVVAIRAGRKATLVVTTGISLKWHDYGSLYVTKVVPKK